MRTYLQQFSDSATGPPIVLSPPKVREVTSWLLRHPDNRSAAQQLRLKQVLTNCAHLAATATHVSTFGEVITTRTGNRLDDWITNVQANDLPHLHSFAMGLRRDRTAARCGPTPRYSSGPVEGSVNRISNDRCTAERTSTYFERGSRSRPDPQTVTANRDH